MSYAAIPMQAAVGSPYAQAMAGLGGPYAQAMAGSAYHQAMAGAQPMQALAGTGDNPATALAMSAVWGGVGAFVGNRYAKPRQKDLMTGLGVLVGAIGGVFPIMIFGAVLYATREEG